MKRHLFTEDTHSFHIRLCLHFKVAPTGCLGVKTKKGDGLKKEQVGGGLERQGPADSKVPQRRSKYIQPRLQFTHRTVSLNTVIEKDDFMQILCSVHEYERNAWRDYTEEAPRGRGSSLTLKSLGAKRGCGDWTYLVWRSSPRCERSFHLKWKVFLFNRDPETSPNFKQIWGYSRRESYEFSEIFFEIFFCLYWIEEDRGRKKTRVESFLMLLLISHAQWL